MALFVFNKNLAANNFEKDAFAVSGLWQIDADTLGFAYDQVTSLGGAVSTKRIYSRKYTISTGALSAEVSVSGAGTYGYWNPAYVGNLDSSVLCVGYEAGGEVNPFRGFVIKESVDGGLTWPVSWTGGTYTNDAFRGLFSDAITGDIYAVTQSALQGGYKVNVHKRTGAGTWSSFTAFTGTNSNTFFLSAYPQQQALFVNGKCLIVGSKGNGSVYAMTAPAYNGTWTVQQILSFSDGMQRACKLVRGGDAVVRLMVPNFDATYAPAPPTICFSPDVGINWTNIGTPPGLLMEDADGHRVGWPYIDGVGFAIDGRTRMYLIVNDIFNGKVQTFRAWSTAYTSWGLIATDTIVDGSSNQFVPDNQSQLPSSSIVVGADIFRVVCSWLGAGYVQAWMLKAASGAIAAGGRAGGGRTPHGYTED